MYKVGVKQKRFNESALSIDKVKSELPDAINEEHKRSNVDSSKKRACLQHMDYDNFHQMVLGANLLPIQKGSIEQIGDKRMKWHGLNTHAALTDIMNKNYKDKKDVLEGYIDLFKQQEELKRVPKSQNEFEKFFLSKLKGSEERFRYILNIPISEVANIFKSDVNSELLVHILNVFSEVISDRIQMHSELQSSSPEEAKEDQKEDQKDESEAEVRKREDLALFSYIGDFMRIISESEGFDF